MKRYINTNTFKTMYSIDNEGQTIAISDSYKTLEDYMIDYMISGSISKTILSKEEYMFIVRQYRQLMIQRKGA